MPKEIPIVEGAQSPEEEERIQALVKLFEAGLDDEEETIGYHGTSLEAIQYMIKNGHLPGGMAVSPQGEAVQGDTLFFYPAPGYKPILQFETNDAVIDACRSYAGILAEVHYAMGKFGLDINDWQQVSMIKSLVVLGRGDPEFDEASAFLQARGFKKNYIFKIIREAEQRKGVVLALSKKMLDRYSPQDAGETGAEYMVHIPEGLNVSEICGLDVKGQQEWDFFAKLQEQIDKK